MQSPPTPRRRGRAVRLLIVVALGIVALLAFFVTTSSPTGALHHYTSSPARALLVPSRTTKRLSLRTVREATSSTPAAGHDDPEAVDSDAVLLPDWEVLVLLHPGAAAAPAGDQRNATCAFPGGAASPARSLGRMPTSGRLAYTCAMPAPERRHKPPFLAPTLLIAAGGGQALPAAAGAARSSISSSNRKMPRWSGRLVYDAAALDSSGGDVVVFAKGVNPRQGVNRNASDVTCIYYRDGDDGAAAVVASLPATTSAQQVFRCPKPPPTVTTDGGDLRVTLAVKGGEPIPSVATYSPAAPLPPLEDKDNNNNPKICACTMVRDVGKFLREWVVYHAAVGVDRFFLYDNGSQDDLESQARSLNSEGFHVSTHIWPWPKTQEAGFSYAAAAHRDSCDWMAFVDVDEFIFSPAWAQLSTTNSNKPPPKSTMLPALVAGADPDVGQITLGCRDFGPSGHTKHPEEGVTQGYTCRRRAEERHKSVVRLDAVDASLVNSIHHFELRPGLRWERSKHAKVNHYKYQAWDEFKLKFRRRVSSYVADWTDRVNHGSKDRTPGLGFEAVEPDGWATKFCDVEDTLLRDVTTRWFGVGFTSSNTKLPSSRRLGPPTHHSTSS
ncbi:unnamed protein product [Urochloa humidicola]